MLVSVDRYREITGDETSASAVVEAALVDAQLLLEEDLRRPLEAEQRTERCRVFAESRGSTVYPAATPLVSVSAPSGGEIVGAAVVGGSLAPAPPRFLTDRDQFAEVTYIGGFDPDAELGDVTCLPVGLQRAIAWAAKALTVPDDFSEIPTGATSASVGDVSISWGAGGSPSSGEVTFSRQLVRRWRRRLDLVA